MVILIDIDMERFSLRDDDHAKSKGHPKDEGQNKVPDRSDRGEHITFSLSERYAALSDRAYWPNIERRFLKRLDRTYLNERS